MVSGGVAQTCPVLTGFSASAQGTQITTSLSHHILFLKHSYAAVTY